MSTERKFWRDEAQISILNPAFRFGFYLTVLGTVASVGSTAVLAVKVWAFIESEPAIVALVFGSLLYPLGLLVELLKRGGAAGNRLIENVETLQSEIDNKPATLSHVKSHLRWLAAWLRKEALLNNRDLTLHMERSREVYYGILHTPLNWETPIFGDDVHISRPQEFLVNKAISIEGKMNELRADGFNPKWKCPEWLAAFGKTIDGQ